MRELRWHGRGGQGAKTIAELFAQALLESGNYVQAFPEYGPERSGAPVQAYTRSSSEPVRLHCGITEPDAVVVLDATLAEEVDVTRGLVSDGFLLINAGEEDGPFGEESSFGGQVIRIDADRLAREVESRYSNMVMAGALAAVLGDPPLELLTNAAEKKLGEKLGEEAMAINRKALQAGYGYLEEKSQPV